MEVRRIMKGHEEVIEQRAFALRQILRVNSLELSKVECERLKRDIEPLLDGVLAADVIVKYMQMYNDGNTANKHNVTLLHVLILFAPDLVELVVKNEEFEFINIKTTSDDARLNASALDLALSQWFYGKCSYKTIELLLRYGATPPGVGVMYKRDTCVLTDASRKVLFHENPLRTDEELDELLVLLGQYGFQVANAFDEFGARWLSDECYPSQTQKITGCDPATQFFVIKRLGDGVLEILERELPVAKYAVELTPERLKSNLSPRRFSQMYGRRLTIFENDAYAGVPHEHTPLAQFLYGVRNSLSDIDLYNADSSLSEPDSDSVKSEEDVKTPRL